jgi:uncharacterized protein with GYD domain
LTPVGKAFKKIGVKLKDTYRWVVMILCASRCGDDETMHLQSLQLGSQGNVRPEALKAFSEADYRKIIGSI